MSGSFLLRIFQVNQNDRSLKKMSPSLRYLRYRTQWKHIVMHTQFQLYIEKGHLLRQRNGWCILSRWSMNYRLYSSTYQKVIKPKIPLLPINKTSSYVYYECFILLILVLLTIVYLWNNQLLAHLSRRLTRWAYSIPMVRRPSVVRRGRPPFQTWISLKPVGQSWLHFMCSITGLGERLHKVLRQFGSKLWFPSQQKGHINL